jgi:hypothetical protein
MRDGILVSDFGRGHTALQRARDSSCDHVCDVGALEAVDGFRLRTGIRPLGTGLLAEARAGWLLDLALDFGFGSDSTFVRAFRRRFDITPGEVKRLASAQQAQTSAAANLDALLGLRTGARSRLTF